ncbi:MAG: SpoIID/LytB domain-containing protein, partial [Acutalibacteraceae bacterium]
YYTSISAKLGDRFVTMVSDYDYGGKIVVIARSLYDDEAADVEGDYLQYKSVGSPYVTDESLQNDEVNGDENLPADVIVDTTDAVTTDEGTLPQNEENAGAILPDVSDNTPITVPPSSSSSSSSSSSASSSESASSGQSTPENGQSGTQIYIVTTQSTALNVRSGPSASYGTVGTLAKGSAVTITEISNGWGHVVSGSIDGWASMSYLTLQSEVSSGSSSGQASESSPSSSDSGSSSSPEEYTYFNASAANEVITVVSSLGNTYTESAYSIICRMVEIEVGSGYPVETIKAQAVASYSYIMYRVRRGAVPSGVSMKAYSAVGTRVKQCVASVIGQTLVYNGKICDAYYSTCTAGITNDVTDVWNSSTTVPYLVPVDSSIDKNYAGFTYTKTMTASDVASRLKTYINTDVSGVADKSSWIVVLGKNKSGVYNGSVSVAGKTTYVGSTSGTTYAITGQRIYSIMNLRSAAFDVSYDAASDCFTFVTYGWGHGVGMSQVGAYYYAVLNGWNYEQILTHYYPGASFRNYA